MREIVGPFVAEVTYTQGGSYRLLTDYLLENPGPSITMGPEDSFGPGLFRTSVSKDVFHGTVRPSFWDDLFSFFKGYDSNVNLTRSDGEGSSQLVVGLDGAETLHAGGGDDWVIGRAGGDTISGGPGNDTVTAGEGQFADVIYGDVMGGGLWEFLLGPSAPTFPGGNDSLQGSLGEDWLSGGAGRDLLSGGAGADVFVFRAGDGADRIQDFSASAGDRLSFSADLWQEAGSLTAAEVVTRYATASGGLVTFDFGEGDVLVLSGLTGTAGLAAQLDLL